jgi:hypothetical protein
MRMTEYNYSISHWVDLFSEMHDRGIFIHHVSSEYESYYYYLDVLKEFNLKFPNKQIEHLVKLAEPHFDSDRFNFTLFQSKIDKYLTDLNKSMLWGIQWMWRGNLNDEPVRLKNFESNFQLLYSNVKKLKKNNIINGFYLFPYTTTFCEHALELSKSIKIKLFDGLTVYRNIQENDFDKYLCFFERNIIIRPLYGGKLNTIIPPQELIEFSLNHKSVEKAIISISSNFRLKELLN